MEKLHRVPPSCPRPLAVGPTCQLHVSSERSFQYASGSMRSSSIRASSAARSLPRSLSASATAPELLSSCAAVTAPESTTGSKGCAMMAASARASGAAPSDSAAAIRAGHCSNRPFAMPSFTMTSSPALRARTSVAPEDCSKRFQVACTASKVPVSNAFSKVLACAGPESERPIRQPRSSRSTRNRSSTEGSSRTPLSSVAECIW
mmetsp:Transcript_41546/g.115551  ORF Transcript_41546/g.115551 Transcript_41546/m.115551 type:complete len:205 (+) Transcript_41546:76-690(+)